MKKNLRIAINAQIPAASGISSLETVLRLLTLTGQLDGDEEYVFIGHWADPDWLKPLLNDRQTIVSAPKPKLKSQKGENLKRLMGPIRPLARNFKHLIKSSPPDIKTEIPTSDGFYESLNCDVIHFPYQEYVHCRMPSVFSPHDLQHLHYPEFFTAKEIERREIIYPAACRAAHSIVVASQFVKEDIIQKYKINADKIQIIIGPPPEIKLNESAQIDVEFILKKYECPPRPFILYPAMTWEHKNHIRLLEAVALLRDRNKLKINLICTGHRNSFFSHIEKLLQELNLESQVKFTGIVDYEELSVLYREAQFVIIPTLFEAASGPLFEAWQHDTAVACSAITSLPEQAADAALLFNPFSVEDIADTLKKMSSDEMLRMELRTRGLQRLSNFDSERTAKAYRAVYRKAAGRELSEEERYLLNWDWMRDSKSEFQTEDKSV